MVISYGRLADENLEHEYVALPVFEVRTVPANKLDKIKVKIRPEEVEIRNLLRVQPSPYQVLSALGTQ